ncbi:MAG: DUF1749 domain-containing protein [Deltaproteobacteria bacterium]|nr:DUF1749 domain-containing protein [Deltaproteobacteria bacterium]
MRKLFFLLICGSLLLWHGCGGFDENAVNRWERISVTDVGTTLQETLWTRNFAPSAKYMKVGLRRLCLKDGSADQGVVVYLPPSGTSARLYTDSENYDFRIYLANRGYAVFSVDYRSSFIAEDENDISSLAGFRTSVTLSDIQQAIAYVKELAGVDKVFLTGHSTGARYVYLYACSRWQEDLAGMIPMDGSPWEMDGRPAAESTLDIEQGYAALLQGDTAVNRELFKSWGMEPGEHYYDVVLTNFAPEFGPAVYIYYASGPNAPSPVPGFPTVTDYLADQFYTVWGDKQLTNVLNGYSTVEVLLDFVIRAGVDHWPIVDYLEDAYLGNWAGEPPLSALQFSKDISSVNIPILVFASQEWTDALGYQYRWKREGFEMIKSADRQYVLLDGFGHLDVLVGEYAKDRVYKVLYDWLEAR